MNWINKTIDLGKVKPHKKYKALFKSVKELDIVTVTTSCGCTTTKPYNKDTKILEVTFTPKNIPVHLRHLEEQKVSKRIRIYYKDGGSEVLSIVARVQK